MRVFQVWSKNSHPFLALQFPCHVESLTNKFLCTAHLQKFKNVMELVVANINFICVHLFSDYDGVLLLQSEVV